MKDTPMPAKQLALLYLIYLLRASVFMDRSGGIVRSKFVYCLYELDRVDQYSWGASVLCLTRRCEADMWLFDPVRGILIHYIISYRNFFSLLSI